MSVIRPCSSVHHHLAMAASSAVSCPALWARMALSTKASATAISVAISASLKRVFWKAATDWPKARRSFTYSSVHR